MTSKTAAYNRHEMMGTMSMGRLIISMSFPLAISQITHALYNMADGIFVSQLGKEALAAISLSSPLQMLMATINIGLCVGMNSLLSRYLGQKRHEEAKSVIAHGIVLTLLGSLLFCILGFWLPRVYFSFMTADETIITLGTEYITICTTYGVFMALSMTVGRILHTLGYSYLSMISQMSGVIINIILDPILIYGLWGMPRLGIRGAAVATVFSQLIAFVVAVTSITTKCKPMLPNLRLFRFDGKIIKGILNVGLPTMVMQGISTVVLFVINRVLGGFSTEAVAVYGIYYRIQSFAFGPMFGMMQGLVPIIGYNYGANKPKRIKQAIFITMLLSCAVMLTVTGLIHLFPETILNLFNSDKQMMEMGVHALRILTAVFILEAVINTLSSTFQGIGKGNFSLINSVVRQVLVRIPAALILSWFLGVNGFWYFIWAADITSTIFIVMLFIFVYRRYISTLCSLPN